MVASGIGLTVLPAASVVRQNAETLLKYIPFEQPAPNRRIVIAWRKSFTRQPAIEAIRRAVQACQLPGVTMVEASPESQ